MSQVLEGHTVQRYDGELGRLHTLVLEMGGLAIDQTRLALQALDTGDLAAARKVLARENQVDVLELEADKEAASVIARRGPVGRDLRVIIAFSKAITDLERIADEAYRIATIGEKLYAHKGGPDLPQDVHDLGDLVLDMLREALQVLDLLDAERGTALVQSRDKLVKAFEASLGRIAQLVSGEDADGGHTIGVVLIIKALERIGHHARNLGEYVIYVVRGEDIRHGGVYR